MTHAWLLDVLVDYTHKLGLPRQAVDREKLKRDFEQGLGTLLEALAVHFFGNGRSNVNLRLAKVRSGGPKNAYAWVERRGLVPQRGWVDPRFVDVQFTVYVRVTTPTYKHFDRLLFALAHELSHVVLYTLGQIQHNEKHVDILTMFFGFADVRMRGKEVRYVLPKWAERNTILAEICQLFRDWLPLEKYIYMPLGYLSLEETTVAIRHIQQLRNNPR